MKVLGSPPSGAPVLWNGTAYRPRSRLRMTVAGCRTGLTAAVLLGAGFASAAPDPGATSINSTSQDSAQPVTRVVHNQRKVLGGEYSVLAINDLGMHCADLDARVVGILPPFQVMLAQVIRRGAQPVLNPAGVKLRYSATFNRRDPLLNRADVLNGVQADGSTYKTNFWDAVALGAYDPFYPAFNPFDPGTTLTPLAGPPFAIGPDQGLPVPNVADLYIGPDRIVNSGDEFLAAVTHAMPGIANPYFANQPQPVRERYRHKPLFVNFPFGYVANDVNWYEGAGIPMSPFDDFGRENPYPMVRVQARQGQTVVATVDTVLPISAEASCTRCHADPSEVADAPTNAPTSALRSAGLAVALSRDDPDPNLPPRVRLEYAADINILRLHDLINGAAYVSPTGAPAPCDITARLPANSNGRANCLTNRALQQKQPVICQTCHYTPALDLAQLGPLAGEAGTVANGRNQLAHASNSRVMHGFHGRLTRLFPSIPAPQQAADGTISNQAERLAALEENCYQCHPGRNTRCLRGAMFNGGVLCSDCHGDLHQIGDDFSRDVSPANPGAFILAADFYTNPDTPRVPWANEPACGSCHTGDAKQNFASQANVLVNTADTRGNIDGIRLRRAFYSDDPKATPIVPINKRFSEPLVPAVFQQPGADFPNPGAGNPRLYRVSTGHGGVMCEGCHGPTHAEWPVADTTANDNVTARQLQGHAGPIEDCATCHGAGWEPGLADALGGPHGMHVVGDTRFANGGHEALAENNSEPCFACHGGTRRGNSDGTVLSRAAVARTLRDEERLITVRQGQPIGCILCHRD